MDSKLALLCYVLGSSSDSAFEVKVEKEETIAGLNKAIKVHEVDHLGQNCISVT
jgi:hypothetical protein